MIVASYFAIGLYRRLSSLSTADKMCTASSFDVVVQFKDTRNLQPDNVELNAVLFFLLLLIVLSFRSDEDHSPSGPVHPSRGTDDALNSLRRGARSI